MLVAKILICESLAFLIEVKKSTIIKPIAIKIKPVNPFLSSPRVTKTHYKELILSCLVSTFSAFPFLYHRTNGAVDFYCMPVRLWCVSGMERQLPLRPPIVASITVFEPFLFPVVRPIQLAARPAFLYLEAVLWVGWVSVASVGISPR